MVNLRKKPPWIVLASGCLAFIALWLLFLAIQIYSFSHKTYSAPADVAIVLGAEVWNERPSPVFEERIKHAVNLYRRGEVEAIIFTGGVGKGDQSAESEVAREYAIEHGVPAGQIYWETCSRTTRENLLEAKKILGWGHLTVLIVSDPLHMKRAVTIAKDLGVDAYPSPTPTSRYQTIRSQFRFLVRETFFYASYLLRRPLLQGAAKCTSAVPMPSISISISMSAPSGCR
jgi:uncharacterized SAM-binding protein YcdF (DUF218 family)